MTGLAKDVVESKTVKELIDKRKERKVSDGEIVKKPLYKKWWFWAIIVFVLICIGAAGSSNNDSESENGGNEISKVEDADLDKLKLNPTKVRNDVTGNWRIATIADPIVISNHAYSYYKNYIKNDEEVHFIVNFTLKTTTKISKDAAGINVTVREYVEGEEHDAKKLGSGMLLSDEYYDSRTGEKFELKGNDAE